MRTWHDLGIDVPPDRHGEYRTTCPACSHTRHKTYDRCLAVNVEKGLAKCWHCLATFSLGLERPMSFAPPPPPTRPTPEENAALGKGGMEWLASRGIPADFARAHGIYSKAGVWFSKTGAKLPAVCFPYFQAGTLVNVKSRATTEKDFMLVKDAAKIFYNLDSVPEDAKTIIITEGEVDALSAELAGYPAISVPNGANSLTPEAMESLMPLVSRDGVHIILAVDGDDAGRKLEDRLASHIGKAKCLRVRWPEGIKDANELLVRDGSEAVGRVIRNARRYPIAGIISPSDLLEDMLQLRRAGKQRGLSTGWKSLDPHYTILPGLLTIITGRPGSGKSTWLDALMVNMVKEHGWGFAITSPEMKPVEDHFSRLMQRFIGKPFWPGQTQHFSDEEAESATYILDEFFDFVLPPDDPTLDDLLSLQRESVLRKNLKGVVLDPWNEINHQVPSGKSMTHYVSDSLRRIKALANEHSVHYWVIAHPTKLVKGNDGKYPVPSMYDISDSHAWNDKADSGIAVAVVDGVTQIHVQKSRFWDRIGTPGMTELVINPVLQTFVEMSEGGFRARDAQNEGDWNDEIA